MSFKRPFYNDNSDLTHVADNSALKISQNFRKSRNSLEESPDVLMHISISKLTGSTSYNQNSNRKELSLLKSVLIINAMKKLENNYNHSLQEQKIEQFGCIENNSIFPYDRKNTNDVKNTDWLFSEYNRTTDISKTCSTSSTDSSILDYYNSMNSYCLSNNHPQNDFLWNQLISGIESFVNEFNNINNKKLDCASMNGSCGNKIATFNYNRNNDERVNSMFLPQNENYSCDYTSFSISPIEQLNNDGLYVSSYAFSQPADSISQANNTEDISNIVDERMSPTYSVLAYSATTLVANSIELCPNSHNYSLVTCGDSSVSLNFVKNGT